MATHFGGGGGSLAARASPSPTAYAALISERKNISVKGGGILGSADQINPELGFFFKVQKCGCA